MSPHEMTVEELSTELRSLRDTPTEQFAAALDSRAAAGFPGRRAAFLPDALPGQRAASRLSERFGAKGRRRLLPMLAGATTVVVAVTAIVIATNSDRRGTGGGPTPALGVSSGAVKAAPAQVPGAGAPSSPRELSPSGVGTQPGIIVPEPPSPGAGTAPGIRSRKIERSADLTLGTDPEGVQAVAGRVVEVVGRYRGIVLQSSVQDGGEGEAGATFDLLIPSGSLGQALTNLSGLAELRSRSENTLDITAPFVSAREHLRDARAEAEGLLRQLAAATTDSERASVKAQLRIVRGRIAAFRSQVNGLERRANFSRVSLQIVTGNKVVIPGATDGNWTIGDALRDAGRVLAVAAGVALVALAAALPLSLLGGACWVAWRIYLRRAREQTLSA